MILNSGDVFSVDESWPKELAQQASRVQTSQALQTGPGAEREIIEAGFAASRGRVSGPSGAAIMLRIPSSTLERMIKALKIRKSDFSFG